MRLGRFTVTFEKPMFIRCIENLGWRITKYDLTILLSALQILYETGIPIMRSLKLLADQAVNPKLGKILQEIRSDIGKGGTFSSSLAKYPKVFDMVFLNVVRVGEAVGDLGFVLKKLTEFERRELDLIRRVQAAMIYPLVVFACSVALIIALAQFLFKNLLPVIQSQGIELPGFTKIVVFLVVFSQNPLVILCLFLFFFGFIYLARGFSQSSFYIDMKDRFIWKVPLLGSTIKKLAMARFCYDLSLLHESGISMLKTLTIAADSCGNTIMKGNLYQVIESLRHGEPLWRSLKNCGIFPPSLFQMVKIGESSGKLSDCLRKLADFYEMEVNYSVENVSSALEPVMISIMGVLVGTIIFVVLSPLYKVIESFGF